MISLLDEYLVAKAGLDKFKKEELKLRNELLQYSFGDNPGFGTHNSHIGDGYLVKGTYGKNVSVSDRIITDLSTLTDRERECIRLSAKLLLSKYDELEDTSRLDEYITIKPGQPSLTIKEV